MSINGGNDKIGYAGAIVFSAGGVTKEELENGDVVFNTVYSGGTLTKPLILARNPEELLEATTKSYVDSSVNSHANDYSLHVTGGTKALLDSLTVTADELNTLHGVTYNVDVELLKRVNRSGDTMTGPFTLFAEPTELLHAATKGYVDDKLSVEFTNIVNTKLSKAGDTMTGFLVLSGMPTEVMHSTPKAYVDIALNTVNNRLMTAESSLTVLNNDPVTKVYVNTQDALKVSKVGDSMTGFLTLSGAPTATLHAATKGYVDTAVVLKLNLTGGSLTGSLTLSGAPTAVLHAATKGYVDSSDGALDTRLTTLEGEVTTKFANSVNKVYVDNRDDLKVDRAGDTMTGALVLSGDPTAILHAATKRYVDSTDSIILGRVTVAEGTLAVLNTDPVTKAYVNTADALKVAKAGDTMTGALTLSGSPVQSLHAVTKGYVDAIDAGLNTRLITAESNLSTLNTDAVTKTYVDAQDALKVSLTGGTMTGALVLSGAPTLGGHSTTKTYVDNITTSIAGRVSTLEGSVSSLITDPVTKTYVNTADALKVAKAGDTMTGLLVLSGSPVIGLHAASKDYVDLGLAGHISNFDVHLTASQNTLLDAITVYSTEINRLSGVTSNVQSQLDNKLSVTGGTITGNVVVAGTSTFTINKVPTANTDAVNKSYVDALVQGLKWKAPVVDSNLLGVNINVPAIGPVVGSSYIVGSAPTGAWVGLSNRLLTYNGSNWIDVLGRDITVGDRLGVGFESLNNVLDTSVSVYDNKIVQVSSINPITLTEEVNTVNDTTLVADSDSMFYGCSYTYNENTGWVKVNNSFTYSSGLGLSLLNSTFSVNISSGLEEVSELGLSKIRAKIHPSSAIIFTLDGTTASTSSAASLAVATDVASIVVTSGKLAVKPSIITSISSKVDRNGDTMTGLLTLSGAPTLGGHATTKTYVDAADSALNTRLTTAEGTIATLNTSPVTKTYVDTQDGLKVAKAGDTMTGALVLSGAPILGGHATTKTYVDGQVSLKVSKTGDTLTGPLVLPADPTLNLQAATKQYVDTRVNRSGDTMTGSLTLFSNPTTALQAATKQYVDTADASLNTRLTTAEGTISTLSTSPVTKTYVDIADALKVAKAGDTMTGLLTLSAAPTVALHAATKGYVDAADTVISGRVTTTETNISTLLNTYTTKTYVDAQDALTVAKTGDTMTGLLTLSANPTTALQAATKQYVDSANTLINTRVTNVEGSITALSGQYTTAAYVDAADALKVNKTGDTMTGPLVLTADPVAAMQAATKNYVDSRLNTVSFVTSPTWHESTNNQLNAGWVNFKSALDKLIEQNRKTLTSNLRMFTPSQGVFPTNNAFISGIVLPDGTVFCVPYNASSARIYDHMTDQVATTAGAYNGSGAYCGAVLLKDGRVFMAPYNTISGKIYNPYNNTLFTTPAIFGGNAEYNDCVLLPDGNVFLVPFNKTTAAIYNITTNTITNVGGTYPGSGGLSSGVLMPDGRVFCIPNNSTTARIYDPVTNTTSTPAGVYPGGGAYSAGTLTADGKVFMVPSNATTARIYDPVTDTVSTPSGVYPGANAYNDATLLMDGRIFCSPANTTAARVYDPYTDTLSVLPDVYVANDYVGSVLLADSRLMIIPTSVNRCKLLNTNGTSVPMSICTSPFFNKR